MEFIEENGYPDYAAWLEQEILSAIKKLPKNYFHYPLNKYRINNDGSFRALVIDDYRISFRQKEAEILIIRIRHTSRKPLSYKRIGVSVRVICN